MRRSIILSLLASAAANSREATVAKLNYEQKTLDNTPTNENKILPIALNGFSPSPKCWNSAIALFHSRNVATDVQDSSALCAAMPESYQKRLALEISNCHLQDLGKPLYREVFSEIDCNEADSIFDDVESMLSVCLKRLTPAGEHAYTIYITYVQNMCIRLTQEILLRYQQENQQELLAQYADASEKSIKNMIAIRDIANMYSEQLIELASLPTMIKEQLSTELSVHLKEVIQTSLQEEIKTQLSAHAKDIMDESLRALIQNHTDIHEKNLITLIDRVERRDEAVKERFDDWIEYLVSLWQRQAVTMEQQQVKFNEHRRQMEAFAATVNSTTNTMQPLLGLQQLMHLAKTGYKWILTILFITIEFSIIWLVTRPGIFRSVRRYLYGILLANILLEASIAIGLFYGKISDFDRVHYVTEIRHWTLIIQVFVFMFGVCVSSLSRFLDWQRQAPSKATQNLVLERFNPNYKDGSLDQNQNVFYNSYQTNFSTLRPDRIAPTFGRSNLHTLNPDEASPIVDIGMTNYANFSALDRGTVPVRYVIHQERVVATDDNYAPPVRATVQKNPVYYNNGTYFNPDKGLKKRQLSAVQEMMPTNEVGNVSTNQSRSTDVIIDDDIFCDPMMETEVDSNVVDPAEVMDTEPGNMPTNKKRSLDGFQETEYAKRVRHESSKDFSVSGDDSKTPS